MGLFEHFPYTNFHDLNLDWILRTVEELYQRVSEQTDWIEEHQKEYEELKALYDQIVSGDFPASMEIALKNWVVDNSVSIIGELIESIFVNLNDEGYIVFFIPESWEDIIFGTTGLDTFPAGVDYGHLTLNY